MIEIKQLVNNEKDEALLFAKKIFIECKDESYSEQGIETFCNFVDSKEITKSFKVYGTFEDNILFLGGVIYEKTCFITIGYCVCIFFWSKLQTLFKR